jgi:peptidoglycan/xylan/chitin deacetylase (PgdA/CDA1 family)
MNRIGILISKLKRRTRDFLGLGLPPNRGMILLYHRITDVEGDMNSISISPENFNLQVEWLTKSFNVISLIEMIDGLKKKNLPKNSIAITFDDGYADNLINAKPILERHHAPATIFVSTGPMESQQEFWWTELERIIFEKQNSEQTLTFTARGQIHQFPVDTLANKKISYKKANFILKRYTHTEREAIITSLKAWAGIPLTARPSHRPMTPTEVREIINNGLIDVGAHTVTHCSLAHETNDIQLKEMSDSKNMLEMITGRPVRCFAYPFGQSDDISPTSASLAVRAGFDCAITTYSGNVKPKTNLFMIPRWVIHNWKIDDFSSNILIAFHS